MSERSGTETRRRNRQVNIRLTPEEWREVTAIADTLEVSPGEVFRRAYVLARDDPKHAAIVAAATETRCTCGTDATSLNPAEVVVHRRDGEPCYITPAPSPTDAEVGDE